jgi:hypothetical protein
MFIMGSACFSSHLVPGSTQPPLAPDRLGEAALSRGDGWPWTKKKRRGNRASRCGPKQNKPKQNKGFERTQQNQQQN